MTPLAVWEALKAGRKLLTLVVVLVGAAAVYVWWQSAERDKASLIAAADGICEAAGSPFRPDDVEKHEWGLACIGEVRRLARVEAELTQGSLDALLEDLERREGKEAADAALAAILSKRAADAVLRMEAADAAVQDDVVGPGWAAAVNDLAGLRDD